MRAGWPTDHFKRRVSERIGANVDPHLLARGLFWAIDNFRTDLVQFVGRSEEKDVRAFLFRDTSTQKVFCAILDTNAREAITVKTENMKHIA